MNKSLGKNPIVNVMSLPGRAGFERGAMVTESATWEKFSAKTLGTARDLKTGSGRPKVVTVAVELVPDAEAGEVRVMKPELPTGSSGT